MFVAIVLSISGAVIKFAEFRTAEEAESHISNLDEKIYPAAFAAPRPFGGPSDWVVDVDDKIVTYVFNIAQAKEFSKKTAKKSMFGRINKGIRWAWAEGEEVFNISLDSDMRELLASWHQILTQPVPEAMPHGGFIISNGIKITGPGGNDIPDAAIVEIVNFSGMIVSKFSRVMIEYCAAIDACTNQAEFDELPDIDFTVSWPVKKTDWKDDLCLYNP